jgi:hypothetical protein
MGIPDEAECRLLAAECEQAMESCPDPQQRAVLTHLQAFWMLLATDPSRGGDDWLACVESAKRLHVDALHRE